MSNLHTVLFLFLREHLWDPSGASFVIFQHCHYHFQHTDADIQLHTQFPGHNLLIRVDELIELFFVPQVTAVHGCPKYGSSFTSLLPPTTSLCSHPLFGLHKHSTGINECQWVQFFPHGGIQWNTFFLYAHPCQTPFCQTAPPRPSIADQQNVAEYF